MNKVLDVDIRPIDYPADRLVLESFLTDHDIQWLGQSYPAVCAGDAFILVACDGRTPIGWAAVHVKLCSDQSWDPDGGTMSFQRGDNAYLENLAISDLLRSQGIGRSLLRAAEDETKQRGKSQLWLHTSESNIRAHQFYERLGYVHERTVCPIWNQGRPMRVYCKML